MRVAERFGAEKTDVPPDFQGDPEVHGIDEPRGGGFSIMQNLQKSLVKEEKKELKKQDRKRTQEEEKINASEKPREAKSWWQEQAHNVIDAIRKEHFAVAENGLRSLARMHYDDDIRQISARYSKAYKELHAVRNGMSEIVDAIRAWEQKNLRKASMKTAAIKEAMYWCGPDRTYRLTKQEQEGNSAVCPRCKGQMEKEPFTRSEKMYRCPGCGFKVPTGKVTTRKIEIEIEPNGEVEVEVTASRRGRK